MCVYHRAHGGEFIYFINIYLFLFFSLIQSYLWSGEPCLFEQRSVPKAQQTSSKIIALLASTYFHLELRGFFSSPGRCSKIFTKMIQDTTVFISRYVIFSWYQSSFLISDQLSFLFREKNYINIKCYIYASLQFWIILPEKSIKENKTRWGNLWKCRNKWRLRPHSRTHAMDIGTRTSKA